jgi:hypothetical protein
VVRLIADGRLQMFHTMDDPQPPTVVFDHI